MIKYLYYSLFLLLFVGCGSDEPPLTAQVLINKIQTTKNLNIFFKTMNQLSMKVYYEPTAAPFSGKNHRDQFIWLLLENNLKEIFSRRNQTVQLDIPKELSEMFLLPVQNKDEWTVEDIILLANEQGNSPSTSTHGKFVTLFLNGNFKDDSGTIQNGVIGLNVSGTTIIAIFKDVVKSLSPDVNGPVVKFGEQSTLVHEMGHALGLVNNGVPLKSEHHDSAHGAHCTNQDCVMYWQNEGGADLVNFVQNLISNGTAILYGEECLKDLDSY